MNNDVLNETKSQRHKHVNLTLDFPELDLHHTGNYTCEASNYKITTKKRSILVTVTCKHLLLARFFSQVYPLKKVITLHLMTISFTTTKKQKKREHARQETNKWKVVLYSQDSLARLSASSVSVADPDLQIREGCGHSDPEIRGGGRRAAALKIFFFASVWSKYKGGGPLGPLPSILHCVLSTLVENIHWILQYLIHLKEFWVVGESCISFLGKRGVAGEV